MFNINQHILCKMYVSNMFSNSNFEKTKCSCESGQAYGIRVGAHTDWLVFPCTLILLCRPSEHTLQGKLRFSYSARASIRNASSSFASIHKTDWEATTTLRCDLTVEFVKRYATNALYKTVVSFRDQSNRPYAWIHNRMFLSI